MARGDRDLPYVPSPEVLAGAFTGSQLDFLNLLYDYLVSQRNTIFPGGIIPPAGTPGAPGTPGSPGQPGTPGTPGTWQPLGSLIEHLVVFGGPAGQMAQDTRFAFYTQFDIFRHCAIVLDGRMGVSTGPFARVHIAGQTQYPNTQPLRFDPSELIMTDMQDGSFEYQVIGQSPGNGEQRPTFERHLWFTTQLIDGDLERVDLLDPASLGGVLNGTGTANQVTWWYDSDTVTGSSTFTWDSANELLSMGADIASTSSVSGLQVGYDGVGYADLGVFLGQSSTRLMQMFWHYDSTPTSAYGAISTTSGNPLLLQFAGGVIGVGGITSPTAQVHLSAQTTSASTAPIKLTSSSSVMSTTEDGAFEYQYIVAGNEHHLYFTANHGGGSYVRHDLLNAGVTTGGSGTDMEVAYWTTSSNLEGDADFLWNYTSHSLIIGPSGTARGTHLRVNALVDVATSSVTVVGKPVIFGDATGVLTGSITPAASASVTGTTTAFLTELLVGDEIKVNTETRTVDSITNNTSLTVARAFTAGAADASVDYYPAVQSWFKSDGTLLMSLGYSGNLRIGAGALDGMTSASVTDGVFTGIEINGTHVTGTPGIRIGEDQASVGVDSRYVQMAWDKSYHVGCIDVSAGRDLHVQTFGTGKFICGAITPGTAGCDYNLAGADGYLSGRVVVYGSLGVGDLINWPTTPESQPQRTLHVYRDSALTYNDIKYLVRLEAELKGTSSPDVGFGAGIEFKLTSGLYTDINQENLVSSAIASIWTDPTDDAEDAAIVFRNVIAGAAHAEVMRLDGPNLAIGTTDMDGTPAIGRLVVKGSTSDGSTNIFVGRDSGEANVATLDTNGLLTLSSHLDVSAVAAGAPSFKLTATSDTPTVTWTDHDTNDYVASTAPAGYIEILIGVTPYYIPYWA